jgi:hypothetical protein
MLLKFRVVSYSEGQTRAKENKIMFKECSAKDGTNIKELFRDIAAALPGNSTQEEGKKFLVTTQLC